MRQLHQKKQSHKQNFACQIQHYPGLETNVVATIDLVAAALTGSSAAVAGPAAAVSVAVAGLAVAGPAVAAAATLVVGQSVATTGLNSAFALILHPFAGFAKFDRHQT